MTTTVLHLPCETGQVRVKLGFGDSLSPLEETTLRVVGAAGDPSDGTARPVDVQVLARLMGLGHRVVLDLVHDLWRAGHLVVDFATGSIDLSPDVAELWRTGRLAELSGVDAEERAIELMIEPLTGHVSPANGRRSPEDHLTAVRALASSALSLADAAQADLHAAARDWLWQQDRSEQSATGDPTTDLATTSTWSRPRRILSIRTPTADQRANGAQRWMRLQVRSEVSEATERLIVKVVDARFPADRRERASDVLTRLVEENPRSQWAIRLREAAEQRLPEPPGVEELIERLTSDAARCAGTVAGQRGNEHLTLAAEARRIEAMLAARIDREMDIDVVSGPDDHDEVVRRMIDTAQRQLVIVCPFVTYSALAPLVPALRRAIDRGVQVVVVWGVGHRYRLPEDVENALNSLVRMSRATPLLRPQVPARTHAKVVVRDDREALVTSRNLLSANPQRHDIGVLVRVPDGGGDEAIRDLLAWVRTNVPGTISRSILHHTHDFDRTAPVAQRTVEALPAPPPDDDEHPESVEAWARAWQAHADWLRGRLTERSRPAVRLVEDGTHRELLWHALRNARRRLVVTSGRLSDEIVDSRMVEAIRRLLDAGVAVTVGYDPKGRTDRFVDAHEALSALATTYPQRFRLHVDSGHAKVLVWDDEVVVGSYNYLSQGGYGAHGGRHTLSTELSVRFSDAALADRLAEQCGEPDHVTRQVSRAAQPPAVPAAQRYDRAVSEAVRTLVDRAQAGGPAAGVVRAVLECSEADPWQVVDALIEVGAEGLAQVAAAYCQTERAGNTDAAVVRRCRRHLVGGLWRDRRYMEAALVGGADSHEDLEPRAPLMLAAAARGLPGAGDALFTATIGENTDAENEALLIIAAGELLTNPDESTTLAAGELATRVAGPWAELARSATELVDRTVGASVFALMASVTWARQRDTRIAAAWEQMERKLAEAQPEPSRIEGALKTHSALFKASGPFGRIGDMVRRRDMSALSRLLDAEFPPLRMVDETVGRLLDRTWQAVAPRSKLFVGRPRAMYVRRLAEVVSAARHLLEIVAEDASPPEHHAELRAAAEQFADGYGRLRPNLLDTGPLAAPLAATLRDELDHLVAGDQPALRVEVPDEIAEDLVGLVRIWPGRWSYPSLAARVHRSAAGLTPPEAARLLLADLDLVQPDPQEAAGRLVAAGEFAAAEDLRRAHVLSAVVAEQMLAELDVARTAAVSRIGYEVNALRRRARRAGLSIDRPDIAEAAADRRADAEELLSLMETEVRDAETACATNLRDALHERTSELRRTSDDADLRTIDAWAAIVEECIEAREFDVARRLLDDDEPVEMPSPGPRAIPALADVWPFGQSSRGMALSWYFGGHLDAPLTFPSWRPPEADNAAWALLTALHELAEPITARQAAGVRMTLQRLVGGEHGIYSVQQIGNGHLTRIWLPDYGMLPALPILGRNGMAVWIAGPDEPPPVDGPLLWLVPGFDGPGRPRPGVAVVDLAFLLRLAAPVPEPPAPTITRFVGLLRRIGTQLGPTPLLADAYGPVSEPQVLWLLHLLGQPVDGVTVEAVHHDCGGRLEVLGPLLDALFTDPARSERLDVAALNRVRNDDTWRENATDRLLQPLAGDLPALLALRIAAAFCGPVFDEEDLREGIAAVGAEAHAQLVIAHTDLALALRKLLHTGLLVEVPTGAYRLPANGIQDLLTTKRPRHNPDDLARTAVEVTHQALTEAMAVRRAAISERVVQLIGHHVAGRLATARSALDEGNIERVAGVLDAQRSILEMYRAATEPNQTFALVELLRETARDIYHTNPDVKCEVDGDESLRVTANRWLTGQAFHNLFDNSRRACEATGRGFGQLRVRVTAVASVDAVPTCRIDIEDDGVGVSPDVRDRLRRGGRSSAWGGRGIGVRTATEWIADFGGTLHLMDGTGSLGGAHVRVVLPLAVDGTDVSAGDS
ncbi:ATP-binding protein [Micromonospora sp. NPDC005367]|uniref:ATP-binding protein n=1 Tax=Micromonospora sp. NPDC005367 TaxID=3155590 RepID=UPI0033A94C1F